MKIKKAEKPLNLHLFGLYFNVEVVNGGLTVLRTVRGFFLIIRCAAPLESRMKRRTENG